MKFLGKNPESEIRRAGLTYKLRGDNQPLRDALLAEQKGFCAYTEERVTATDTVAVEHFNASLKRCDDYFNYYATQQTANQRKRRKERAQKGASFFTTRWFQQPGAVEARLEYVPDSHTYQPRDARDTDAATLISYLGMNAPELVDVRTSHVYAMLDIFELGQLDVAGARAWFAAHPRHLSFITALEATLGYPLADLL